MGRTFRIEGAVFLAGALAMLLVPLNWLVSAVAAAAVHESCHYLTACMMRIPVYQIRVCCGGCRMVTGPMEKHQELICAAAGPLGSLLLVFLIRPFPRMAICAGIQGLYNLLPVYPMDGGRIVLAAAGERGAVILSRAVGCLVLIVGCTMTILGNLGPLPMIFGLIIVTKALKLKNFLQTGQTHSTIELPIFKR